MNNFFQIKNLPNSISAGRIILTIFFIILMSISFKSSILIANIIFIIASITDFFDGYYARKYNVISNIGKVLDPLADKILVNSCYIFLTGYGYISPFICVIIISREIIITSLRIFASEMKITLAANSFGKIKTTLLIIIAVIYLEKYSLDKNNLGITYFINNKEIHNYLFIFADILLYLTTAYTALTLISYFLDFYKKIDINSTPPN